MNLKVELIQAKDLTTAAWSGGTTTQLAIHPSDAVYSERDFIWRLSSAVVEAEESEFTALPGYDRILMILKGVLDLDHKGHHTARLHPYEQDAFKGSWKTFSKGRVTDFNLMTKEGCHGQMKAYHLEPEAQASSDLLPDSIDWAQHSEALYCVEGKAYIQVESYGTYLLEAGDVLLIQGKLPAGASLEMKGCHDAATHLIHSMIDY